MHRTPASIEQESLAVIREAIGPHRFDPEELAVVERMVQATADLDFARITEFRRGPIDAAVRALRAGTPLLVDVEMVVAGLRQDLLGMLGVPVRCAIRDEGVRRRAMELGTTRAAVAIETLLRAEPEAVPLIGNAPTALLRMVELLDSGRISPPVVIGLPVGFILATEAKDLLREAAVPALLCRGRKGGSAVAVAVMNRLLALAAGETQA